MDAQHRLGNTPLILKTLQTSSSMLACGRNMASIVGSWKYYNTQFMKKPNYL